MLLMHCDDKRTIFVLKQNIAEAISELKNLETLLEDKADEEKKQQTLARIRELEKIIKDSTDQLSSMQF